MLLECFWSALIKARSGAPCDLCLSRCWQLLFVASRCSSNGPVHMTCLVKMKSWRFVLIVLNGIPCQKSGSHKEEVSLPVNKNPVPGGLFGEALYCLTRILNWRKTELGARGSLSCLVFSGLWKLGIKINSFKYSFDNGREFVLSGHLVLDLWLGS